MQTKMQHAAPPELITWKLVYVYKHAAPPELGRGVRGFFLSLILFAAHFFMAISEIRLKIPVFESLRFVSSSADLIRRLPDVGLTDRGFRFRIPTQQTFFPGRPTVVHDQVVQEYIWSIWRTRPELQN